MIYTLQANIRTRYAIVHLYLCLFAGQGNSCPPILERKTTARCGLGKKQVGGKLSEPLNWTEKAALFSPQDRFLSKLGFVSQQDFAVKAGLKLLDLKVGRVNITCDLSAGVTTTEWRKFTPTVSGFLQVGYSF